LGRLADFGKGLSSLKSRFPRFEFAAKIRDKRPGLSIDAPKGQSDLDSINPFVMYHN
jgi:hypothetical protein